MKMNFFISTVLFLLIAMFTPQMTSAQKYGIATDTINASEDFYVYIGGSSLATSEYFPASADVNILFKTDSLSGSTNATLILQGGLGYSPTIWYNINTTTLNGAASQYYLYQTTTGNPFLRYRYRMQGTGTQATKVVSEWFTRKRTNGVW